MHKLRLALSPAWSTTVASLEYRDWEVMPAASDPGPGEAALVAVEVSQEYSGWREALRQARRSGTPVLALWPAAQTGSLSEVMSSTGQQEVEWFPVPDWQDATRQALARRLEARAAMLDLSGELEAQQRQQQARESLVQKLVHDMKSPLTVMLMDLGMLERWWEKRNSERFQVGVERVTQNCEELIGMIQNLLDANRLRWQQMEVSLRTLGAGAVLREVLENPPSALAKKSIQLRLDLRHTETSLEMDGSIIGRVLENLLKVAARTTPKGGHIELSADRNGETMNIEVGVPQASFDAGQAEALLEPYAHEKWRSLGVDAGNGTGFNFCRMAIQRHGGELNVVGRESGVAFAVRLPLSPRQL